MSDDPFDLERFFTAQAPVYARVLDELRAGRKRSHWMWFIFPQLCGLGRSHTALRYGITGRTEAIAYLAHPVLGPRLIECTRLLLAIEGRNAQQILGSPDDLKLRSCMTLFGFVSDVQDFARALAKYYGGEQDPATLALLAAG